MAILKNIPAERIIPSSKKLAEILGKTEATICLWKKAGRLDYMEKFGNIFYDSENIFASESKRVSPRKK